MAESATEIANLALSHVGSSSDIADLDTEASAEATACRRFYATCLRQTLRDFHWPFATKYAALGLVEETPAAIDGEWAYSYRYPSDCVKFRRIVSNVRPGTRQALVPFQIARDATGLLIYCNLADAEAEYTYAETEVIRFPDDLVMAISLRLAAYIAPRVTGGDQFKLGPRAMQLYAWEIDRAKASAGNEEQAHEEPASQLERDRA